MTPKNQEVGRRMALPCRSQNVRISVVLGADGEIQRRDRLGGLIHDHYRAAA